MRALSAAEGRLWLVALVCFAAFALLGAYVSSRTPTRIDVEATVLRGELTPLAIFFTALGRWWVVLPVAAGAFAVALALRANPLLVAGVLISQTLSQAVVNLAKHLYGRPRPDDWLVYREQGLSFPSGHATTTVVFYVALALLALRAPALPRGIVFGSIFVAALCAVGIPWSRLALGAHYATDVIGGLLFGAGWLCASVALLYRFGSLA
jgi:membrane-associated phospholipid phosphatase